MEQDAIRRAVRIRDSKGCFLFYSEGDKKDAEMDNFLKKDRIGSPKKISEKVSDVRDVNRSAGFGEVILEMDSL